VKLLLDTHIWLWLLLEPNRLVRRVADALTDPANELWLSPISVWEALLLVERGRVEVDRAPGEWLDRALRDEPLRDAPVTRAVALSSRSLDLAHEDPADRFIAATAMTYELTLVSGDARLLESTSYPVLANR